MGSSRADSAERAAKPAKRIISRFVSEEQRLARTARHGHLYLLGKELGVKNVLTRPMTGAQEQHPGIDAMLVPLPEGYSVVINERAPETRRAYSLAHELAHIMLLELKSSAEGVPKAKRYRSANEKWKAEERLCDAIAAELLMPEDKFSEVVARYGQSVEHLPRLANMFGTSLTSTAIRYWELLPEPCHLISWKPRVQEREVIAPNWQMRNTSPGPKIYSVTAFSIARRNEFQTLRKAWRTMRTSVSYESLLVKHVTSGKRYARPAPFETESIGFGASNNRTVLSAVYLGRTVETT
jgi:Zn-dependent peptidase ImmA (M78 family)